MMSSAAAAKVRCASLSLSRSSGGSGRPLKHSTTAKMHLIKRTTYSWPWPIHYYESRCCWKWMFRFGSNMGETESLSLALVDWAQYFDSQALNEHSDHEVHLYEAANRPGGHANTVTYTKPGDPSKTVDVDTWVLSKYSFTSLYDRMV